MTRRYTDNCPAVPEAFDSSQPVSHSRPVHHFGMRMQDYHPACLWDQLQWERERNDGGPQYLENLEAEWQKRNLCSHCLRELDHPFMTEVDELRRRAERAEAKLAAIRDTGHYPDAMWRSAVVDILDREEEPGVPTEG